MHAGRWKSMSTETHGTDLSAQTIKPDATNGGDERGSSPLGIAGLTSGVEPVPGYRLIERLGGGGFGEVWKARGPGGFEVALKFVACQHEGVDIELRALEVIKTIRHPN